MEYLLNQIDSIFNNISNYFLVEESKDICDKYCLLESKMKKCINSIESIIDESMNIEKNTNKKLVFNYFIEISMLMDLIFQTFNIYYKNDKQRKYNSFYKEFELDANEYDKEILKLQWYQEIAAIRNLRIHEYEDIDVIYIDKRLYFQHYDDIEYPTIISEYCDYRFYVNFIYYSVEKLNTVINLMRIIFNIIVKQKSKLGMEILEERAEKFRFFKNHTISNEKYDEIFNQLAEIEKSLDLETRQIIRFLRLFERKEDELLKLITLIEKGDFQELPSIYEVEPYFQLSIIKYKNNHYEDGLNLLWMCLEKYYNSAFLSNLLCGYLKMPDLLSDDIIHKLDRLIEDHIADCFRDHNFDFFSNASSYYRNTNRESQALNLAKMGVNIEPMGCHDLNLLYNYGCLLQRSGEQNNFMIAKEVFLRIIELEPTDSNAYHHLIECYFLLGEYNNLNLYLCEAKRMFPQEDKFEEIDIKLKEYFKSQGVQSEE